MNKEQRI